MPTSVHGAAGEGTEGHPAAEDRPDVMGGDKSNNTKQAWDKHGARHVGLAGEVGSDDPVRSVDSISKDAMLGEPKVSEEDYAGRGDAGRDGNDQQSDADMREQEKENFIQEELYIHGKVLIVDDRVVICGSSNINDRSQLGFHDSELSIVMEDTLAVDSTMD
ncbi:hypothetical protein LTR48_008994, partial [Friedmanniomyces endolithicus]